MTARGIPDLELVEGYWEDGRAKQWLLSCLCRRHWRDPKMIDRLRASLKRYTRPSAVEGAERDLDAPPVSLEWRVGNRFPLEALWQELEFDRILCKRSAGRCSAPSQRRPRRLKLAHYERLRHEVEALLADVWSTQQVSAHLREAYAEDTSMRGSHETIYQALFVQG